MPFIQSGSQPVANIHSYNDTSTSGGKSMAFNHIGEHSFNNCTVPLIGSWRSLTLILKAKSIVKFIALRDHVQTPKDPLHAGLYIKTLVLKRGQGSVQIKGVNNRLTLSQNCSPHTWAYFVGSYKV